MNETDKVAPGGISQDDSHHEVVHAREQSLVNIVRFDASVLEAFRPSRWILPALLLSCSLNAFALAGFVWLAVGYAGYDRKIDAAIHEVNASSMALESRQQAREAATVAAAKVANTNYALAYGHITKVEYWLDAHTGIPSSKWGPPLPVPQ